MLLARLFALLVASPSGVACRRAAISSQLLFWNVRSQHTVFLRSASTGKRIGWNRTESGRSLMVQAQSGESVRNQQGLIVLKQDESISDKWCVAEWVSYFDFWYSGIVSGDEVAFKIPGDSGRYEKTQFGFYLDVVEGSAVTSHEYDDNALRDPAMFNGGMEVPAPHMSSGRCFTRFRIEKVGAADGENIQFGDTVRLKAPNYGYVQCTPESIAVTTGKHATTDVRSLQEFVVESDR